MDEYERIFPVGGVVEIMKFLGENATESQQEALWARVQQLPMNLKQYLSGHVDCPGWLYERLSEHFGEWGV